MKIKNEYAYLLKCELKSIFLKRKVQNFLSQSKEKDICDFLKGKIKLSIMPYAFADKYKSLKPNIFKDKECGLFYLMDNGKKLYLQKKFFLRVHAARYYRNLCMEQDKESPHAYLSDDFDIDDGSILFDIGAAEGIFALRNIDKISEVYLFECDDRWIEALRHTFKDYKDKVHIIKKYVGANDSDQCMTLDSFKINGASQKNVFLKMDIEGAEIDALSHSKKFLSSVGKAKISVCTYHRADHFNKIKEMFSDYIIKASDGYMFFYYDKNFEKPYLRKGVLRIEKNIDN